MRPMVLAAMLVLIFSALAQGQGYQSYPSEGSQMSESMFYTGSTPSDAGRLTQVGQAQVSVPSTRAQFITGNALWIVDPKGQYRRTSLRIPLRSWAREELIPGTSGPLTIYERYPGGSVQRYNMGYAYAGYRYMVWFHADTAGTHDIWYRVGGQDSNHVSFSVYRTNISPGPFYPWSGSSIYSSYSRVGTSTGGRGSP